MENRDETVFVNYEKLGQGQNLTSAEGKRTESRPKEGRKPADQLEQAYRDLGKAYYEGGSRIRFRSFCPCLIRSPD